MSDVFVSYKTEDVRRVRPLVEALEADGYSVWWDEQIGGGTAWRHAIEAELNAAKCVIVAWSKRSTGPDGGFVQDEAARAQQRQVYVPVTIDKVRVPLGFGETQALPLTGWKGERADPRYQAVLAAVRRIAGPAAGETIPPGAARPTVSRRAVLAGGAVATATAAGVGGWFLLKPDLAAASDSIAVLPFANLSGDPGQAYFSDGIAEELRSALARVAKLKVVGRTSSEAVRDEDVQTAARKLGVPNILTGSVRRSPATIRISAQLVDGRTGIESWTEKYDRRPGDIIEIQTDIAENIARSLSIALGRIVREALTLGGTRNDQAHNLVLRAEELTSKFKREMLERAIELADQAIALDPRYALAYAVKADTLLSLAEHSSDSDEVARIRAEAMQLARRSIAIEPRFPAGHSAVAAVHLRKLEIRPAIEAYNRAFQLTSGDAASLRHQSFIQRTLGRTSEAVRLADRALSLEPLDPSYYSARALSLYLARRYGEVLAFAEQLKRNSPQFFRFISTVGSALMMLGRFDEARKAYAEVDDGGSPYGLVDEAILAAREGDRVSALKTIEGLRQSIGDAASYQYAEIHAALGNVDQAFAALDRAWQFKDSGLLVLKVDPVLDPIRRDPRFAALIETIGYPH